MLLSPENCPVTSHSSPHQTLSWVGGSLMSPKGLQPFPKCKLPGQLCHSLPYCPLRNHSIINILVQYVPALGLAFTCSISFSPNKN